MPKVYVKKQKGITTIAKPIVKKNDRGWGGFRPENMKPSIPDELAARRERILELLKEHGKLTVGEVADHLGIAKADADRSLQRLFRMGKVQYGKQGGRGKVLVNGVWWLVEEALPCR